VTVKPRYPNGRRQADAAATGVLDLWTPTAPRRARFGLSGFAPPRPKGVPGHFDPASEYCIWWVEGRPRPGIPTITGPAAGKAPDVRLDWCCNPD